jgi:hypothetical protein
MLAQDPGRKSRQTRSRGCSRMASLLGVDGFGHAAYRRSGRPLGNVLLADRGHLLSRLTFDGFY